MSTPDIAALVALISGLIGLVCLAGGYFLGHGIGHRGGYDAGYDAGRRNGHDDGDRAGHARGLTEGRVRGIAEERARLGIHDWGTIPTPTLPDDGRQA